MSRVGLRNAGKGGPELDREIVASALVFIEMRAGDEGGPLQANVGFLGGREQRAQKAGAVGAGEQMLGRKAAFVPFLGQLDAKIVIGRFDRPVATPCAIISAM